MSLDHSIGLGADYEVERMEGHHRVWIYARYTAEPECPHCGQRRVWIKATRRRVVEHESLGTRRSCLVLRARKFLCRGCGRYFNERFPGVLPHARSTEAFRREVFQKHHDGICQTTLARDCEISPATVERWYQDHLKRVVAELDGADCPKVLGIDEQFFSRKDGYATTLCNLGAHRVFDVTLGRSEGELEPYLQGLKGRDNVKVICMDLSTTYRRIARRFFPQAQIVADRFHVIRLVNHQFLETWKLLDEPGRKNRGLLSLMRRHESKLTPEQVDRLDTYLKAVPGLEAVYRFWRELWRLLRHKHCHARRCRRLAPQLLAMIGELKASAFSSLQSLGHTLDNWKNEIAAMWRFTKNNGITEGFHNKIETIKRRSYGFRNFANFRLRVKATCC